MQVAGQALSAQELDSAPRAAFDPKWLVIGRARAGRYPLWGVMYFRWWLVDRISEIPPRHLLSGSPLHAIYLRALGDHAHLGGLSSLVRGQRVPARELWEGSPSRFVKHLDGLDKKARIHLSAGKAAMELALFFFGSNLVSVVFFLPVFPSFILIDWIDGHWLDLTASSVSPILAGLVYLLIAIPASAVLVLTTVLASAAFRWIVLPRLEAGSWSIHSPVYYGKWLGNQIQESSLAVLHGLYATVYAPWWYRLLGARVGRGTEISTALGVVPDMLTIGTDSFVADGVMLGDERIEGGWMTLQPTVIGNRSFLGNGAFVPDGSVLPDDVLIGVQSKVPENARMNSGDTWVGNPPIILPSREMVAGFDASLTFHPSWRRRMARGIVEGLRIVMPMSVVIAVGY
ncbi:MAG: peptide synthetase, partial [Burkholderiales bacterium 21-58-4]